MGKKKFSDDLPDLAWESYGKGASYPKVKQCYESHPALPVGDHVIYGGSCISPAVKDADVYVGFDHGMNFLHSHYPWEEQSKVVEFLFRINDMAAPSDPKKFKAMVEWVCNQLQQGKKVHAGCIGGHGRTGTFLSAVVREMTGEVDATSYVRENYCDHAVESAAQVKFLSKHYGIKEVAGYKEGKKYHGSNWPHTGSPWPSTGEVHKPSKVTTLQTKGAVFSPVPSTRCLWGK